MNLLISPHNDDAALFAAFTLMRKQPLVVTVFDSFAQVKRGFPHCDWQTRRKEDAKAFQLLNCPYRFSGIPDEGYEVEKIRDSMRTLLRLYSPDAVYIPAFEADGHEQHNHVSLVCTEVFAGRISGCYYTYTRTGGKTVKGTKVEYNGQMAQKKLQALLCYETQLTIDALGCYPHFIRNLEEYMETT